MVRYLIPSEELSRVRIEVKRSVFITSASHAPCAKAAQDFMAKIRKEFPDATHNCWAFVAGPPGDTRSIGMSDDGEPHGTAGRPMLQVLIHSSIGEIVCVVTRYYGGTKLGTGGLARAYGQATEEVLKRIKTKEYLPRISAKTQIVYSFLERFRQLLDQFEVLVEEETFSEQVNYRLAIPEEHLKVFHEALANLTQGRSHLE